MSEVEKVRSAEKEADLDRKIQEIRRRNEELEERHKIIAEEAKQNGVPKSFQKATVHGHSSSNNGGGNGHNNNKSGSNHANLKTSETIPASKKGNNNGIAADTKGNNQWSREWDRGKTSAEDWKMNVPEFGDHGNSYFKTDSSNGNSSTRGNRRDSGGRGGSHNQQQRGGRRPGPGQGNRQPQQPHNPGFFHDDRFDAKNKGEENGTENGTTDGKQTEGGQKKFPARNNNNPRKPATMNNKSFDNDKNQNDSSKPNMNVSNGFGTHPHRSRGGAAPQQQHQHQQYRNFNNQPRRGGTAGGASSAIRQPHQNGANREQTTPNKPETQRKPLPKVEGDKPQSANRDAAVADKQRSGPSNRGKNFKPFNNKPAYSNPRQNKVPQKSSKPSSNGTTTIMTKPQNQPKLDKDGQAVKRLIDNIIDQVVRHERKEQKKNEEEQGEEIEEKQADGNQSNEATEATKTENQENLNVNEEKKVEEKSEEKPKEDENVGGAEEKKDETKNENGTVNGISQNESDTKVESNDAEKPTPEGNSNESKPVEPVSTEPKTDESHVESSQEQKSENQSSDEQPQPSN